MNQIVYRVDTTSQQRKHQNRKFKAKRNKKCPDKFTIYVISLLNPNNITKIYTNKLTILCVQHNPKF